METISKGGGANKILNDNIADIVIEERDPQEETENNTND